MERQQATGGPAGGGGATGVPDGGLRRPRTALAVLLLGSFIGVLDPFVVTVALPAIGLDLDAGFAQAQWVIAAYGTAYAAGLVCGARLGDLFGRRRLFVGGTVLYSLGSVAAGAAPTAGALIGARDVQGLGAAAMLPQILSIIRMDFPPAARGRAIGRYGARIGLGVVSGPVLGGLLLAAAPGGWGWRAIFLLNLPLGVVVAAGALLAVLGPRGRGTGGVDLVGAALSAAALLALVVPVTQAASTGWPWWSTAALASAPVLLIGFLAHERRVEARGSVPLVPRRLFRSHEFSRGLGAVLLLYAAGAGAPLILLLTFHLQEGLGASALRTGIVFAPLGLGFAAASALAARLTARWGLRVPAAGTGTVVVALGGAALVGLLPAQQQPWVLMPVLLVAGAGQGLATNPLITLVLGAVADSDTGSASGVLLATTQVANVVGVAAAGAVFSALLADGGGTVDGHSRALTGAVALLAGTTAATLLLVGALARRARPQALAEHPG